jgi:hypothetical protein
MKFIPFLKTGIWDFLNQGILVSNQNLNFKDLRNLKQGFESHTKFKSFQKLEFGLLETNVLNQNLNEEILKCKTRILKFLF